MRYWVSAPAYLAIAACRGNPPPQPMMGADAPIAVGSTSPPPAPSPPLNAVRLEVSEVAKCIVVTPHPIDGTDDDVRIGLDIQSLTSVGACGCTSLLLAFSVIEAADADGGEPWIEHPHGTFDSRKPTVTLHLGNRAGTPPGRTILRIGCSGA